MDTTNRVRTFPNKYVNKHDLDVLGEYAAEYGQNKSRIYHSASDNIECGNLIVIDGLMYSRSFLVLDESGMVLRKHSYIDRIPYGSGRSADGAKWKLLSDVTGHPIKTLCRMFIMRIERREFDWIDGVFYSKYLKTKDGFTVMGERKCGI